MMVIVPLLAISPVNAPAMGILQRFELSIVTAAPAAAEMLQLVEMLTSAGRPESAVCVETDVVCAAPIVTVAAEAEAVATNKASGVRQGLATKILRIFPNPFRRAEAFANFSARRR
jgi:hypothetical protein